ncbi:retention module-containing protein, partial [Aeromonas veronii]|uniref:retention module-containing protein n=1 Tax=Aeromonas veronii TaxID=654 RepID=UPI003BA26386
MITNAVTLEQGVTVTQLKGQIYLVAADGSRKLLAEGDVLPKGAVIVSPDGASFMGGGQSFTVQPASEQSEPAEEGDAPQLAQNGAAGTPDDISALQQAILGGADPTQAFEASAAGGAPAAGGGGIGGVAGASGNGGFVTIDRTGSATIAEATFDTTYNANGELPLGAAGEDEVFDLTPPTISVVAPDNTNDTTPTLTGTTDAPVGSIVTLLVTDANGNQQTLTATVTPAGTFTVDVVTPLAEGSYTVTATVTDPAGNTGSATDSGSVDIDYSVESLNDNYEVNEDGSVSLTLLANDKALDGGLAIQSINGVVLTGGAQSIAVTNGTVEIAADGSISFVPGKDFNGDISFDYVARDADGDTNSATVSVTVTPVVDIVTDTLNTTEDNAVTLNVLTNDSFENANAAVTAVTQGANGSVSFDANGEVTYTPNANFHGTDSFTYTVTSGGVTETITVNVNVGEVDDPTTITGDASGSGAEDGGTIVGTLSATDADGLADGSVFSVTGNPANGTATIDPVTGAWSYTPVADWHGSDSFTVTITDDEGHTTTQVISVTVTPVVDIVTDTLNTTEDNAVTLN